VKENWDSTVCSLIITIILKCITCVHEMTYWTDILFNRTASAVLSTYPPQTYSYDALILAIPGFKRLTCHQSDTSSHCGTTDMEWVHRVVCLLSLYAPAFAALFYEDISRLSWPGNRGTYNVKCMCVCYLYTLLLAMWPCWSFN